MLLTRLIGIVSFLLFVHGSDTQAQAYERARPAGRVLCQASRTFTYALSTSASRPTAAERAAILAAVDAWRQAASSCSDLVFEQAADVPEATPIPRDGKTLVTLRTANCVDVVPSDDECYANDSCGEKYGCWDAAPSDVVRTPTPVIFSLSTGEIFGARIELNASKGMLTTVDGPPCPQGTIRSDCVVADVQSLVTRSIGETLGFALVARTDSTMSSRLPWGDTQKRIIDPGTLQGLCEVYPGGQPTPDCASEAPPDAGAETPPDAGTETPPDAGTETPPDAGTPEEPPPPTKGGYGCGSMSSAPLLGALMLLLGIRRRSRECRKA